MYSYDNLFHSMILAEIQATSWEVDAFMFEFDHLFNKHLSIILFIARSHKILCILLVCEYSWNYT